MCTYSIFQRSWAVRVLVSGDFKKCNTALLCLHVYTHHMQIHKGLYHILHSIEIIIAIEERSRMITVCVCVGGCNNIGGEQCKVRLVLTNHFSTPVSGGFNYLSDCQYQWKPVLWDMLADCTCVIRQTVYRWAFKLSHWPLCPGSPGLAQKKGWLLNRVPTPWSATSPK